jgi:hypothetical protein
LEVNGWPHKPKVGTKPHVAKQVEITDTIMGERHMLRRLQNAFISFLVIFHKDFRDEIQSIEGVMLRG